MQGEEGRFVRAREVMRMEQGKVLGAWMQEGNRMAWLIEGRGLVLASLITPEQSARLVAPISAFTTVPLRVAVTIDGSAVALMRTAQQVDVMRTTDGATVTHTRKTGKLLGVHWALQDPHVLLVVCDQALLLLDWDPQKPSLKTQKEQRVSVVCYRYDSRVLVVGLGGVLVAAYVIKRGGRIEALGRAMVDTKAARPVLPTECHLVQLYHRLYFLYIDAPHAQVLLFQLTTTDVTLKKRLSLFLPAASGRVALSVADNLLLVHHTGSEGRITSVFDIKDAPQAAALSPLAGPLPLYLEQRSSSNLAPLTSSPSPPSQSEAYAPDWEYTDGQYVVAQGALQVLVMEASFEALAEAIIEPDRRVAFLLRRLRSRAALAAYLRLLLLRRTPLTTLSAIWDMINSFLDPSKALPPSASSSNPLSSPQSPTPSSSSLFSSQLAVSLVPSSLPTLPMPGQARVDGDERRNGEGVLQLEQDEMYSLVLEPVDDTAPADDHEQWPSYYIGALIEYVRSLNFAGLPVAHFIQEQLIAQLVRHRRFPQLHHLLQYHVIADSVPLASKLLSLETGYAPTAQLALDMLKRLSSAEQIAEVLLSRQDVLAALRVLRANPNTVRISPLRFLEAAEQRLIARQDSTLYHTVYAHFFPNVLRQPDAPPVLPPKTTPEDRSEYLRHAGVFRSLFGSNP